MNRKELAQELARGTKLVVAVASGGLDVREFVEKYNNFYYYNALDGHEVGTKSDRLIGVFDDACRLHEVVQTDVIDQIYLGTENIEQYVAAGRILPDVASDRLRKIADTYDAVALLNRLREEGWKK